MANQISQAGNSNSVSNNTTKKGSYHQVGDQYFYVEISLYNQIEGQKPLYVPFFYVDSLKIHESIFNWITKGEIVFNSDFEISTFPSNSNCCLRLI